MTRRPGRYFAIASTFGVRPESDVVGTPRGYVESSSTAMTWEPAPIAKSMSVAVGESETIRLGATVRWIGPFAATTVTGNGASPARPPAPRCGRRREGGADATRANDPRDRSNRALLRGDRRISPSFLADSRGRSGRPARDEGAGRGRGRYPSLDAKDDVAGSRQVSWLPDRRSSTPSQDPRPSGDCLDLLPGHSGATAPDSHRLPSSDREQAPGQP